MLMAIGGETRQLKRREGCERVREGLRRVRFVDIASDTYCLCLAPLIIDDGFVLCRRRRRRRRVDLYLENKRGLAMPAGAHLIDRIKPVASRSSVDV